MNGPFNTSVRDFSKLVAAKIEDIRPRLLDLTSKNPLVNMSFDARSASQIRVVDELPDRVFYSLNNDNSLKFRSCLGRLSRALKIEDALAKPIDTVRRADSAWGS
ncbi:DUF4011 domain-containing protein [Rhizobium leguminosarum]|uniref:DUF4011 domain-containing protein n=1 Tax=Rhizobium TaxID=379 RepID=UPI0010378BA1|nr:DUF4011 domain-containing protein [Rhizobium leguminosarum]TBG01178.1 DUF4011 domain-containing protein [Rhizobium leguminosarum]